MSRVTGFIFLVLLFCLLPSTNDHFCVCAMHSYSLWIQFAKQALAENLELHNLAKFCKTLNDITEMPFTFFMYSQQPRPNAA